MLQFPLLQQPAGVRDDGYRLQGKKRWPSLGEQQNPMDSSSYDAESTKRCQRKGGELPSPHLALQRLEQSCKERAVCSAIHTAQHSVTEVRQGYSRGPRMDRHLRMAMLECQVPE